MGGRSQIFVSNVSHPRRSERELQLKNSSQLPFNVGWQDLKDLFRQGGKSKHSIILKVEPR